MYTKILMQFTNIGAFFSFVSRCCLPRICDVLNTLLFKKNVTNRDAERNQRSERFFDQGSPKGCPCRQNKEESIEHQIQDPLLTLFVHIGCC